MKHNARSGPFTIDYESRNLDAFKILIVAAELDISGFGMSEEKQRGRESFRQPSRLSVHLVRLVCPVYQINRDQPVTGRKYARLEVSLLYSGR